MGDFQKTIKAVRKKTIFRMQKAVCKQQIFALNRNTIKDIKHWVNFCGVLDLW